MKELSDSHKKQDWFNAFIERVSADHQERIAFSIQVLFDEGAWVTMWDNGEDEPSRHLVFRLPDTSA